MALSEEYLITSIRKKPFFTLMLTRKYLFFYKADLNVLYIYIIHETLTYEDKEPLWLNWIKSLLKDKKMPCKDWRRINANAQLLDKLKHTQEHLNFLINRPSQNYYVEITKRTY